jgi:ATP-binding cassette subfamily F protein 3
MEKHQQELRTLEERLADPAIYENNRSAELQQLLRTQGTLRQQLEENEEAWLTASEELERETG